MAREERVFKTGDVIADRYEIVEELGRGAYGVVFRAIQLGIGRHVALKTLLPQMAVDSEEHQRFEREALMISRLSHPNIITLFDYGEHQGVLFMVMEYVEGRSLGDMIEAEAPVSVSLARTLAYQMLDALQFAHDQGVVHRDLKPENIRLIRNPSIEGEEKESLKILDFGIAKFVAGDEESSALDTLTQGGIALGTPQYMSPENITGDVVSYHADLYAVGLILYEMLTGEPAFTGATPHVVMVAHIKDDPPNLPDTPEMLPFVRALEWSLRKQPDERVPSARAMRELLEEDVTLAPGAMTQLVPVVTSGSESSTGAMIAVILAALVVILLSVLVVIQDKGVRPQVVQEIVETPVDSGGEAEKVERSEEMDFAEMRFGVEESDEVETDVVEESEYHQEQGVAEERGEEIRMVEVEEVEEIEEIEEVDVAREEPQETASVELRISSQPENARITLDGRPVGTSPLIERVPRSEETIEIGFSLIGYRDTVSNVVPDESQHVEIRLERGRLDLVP